MSWVLQEPRWFRIFGRAKCGNIDCNAKEEKRQPKKKKSYLGHGRDVDAEVGGVVTPVRVEAIRSEEQGDQGHVAGVHGLQADAGAAAVKVGIGHLKRLERGNISGSGEVLKNWKEKAI